MSAGTSVEPDSPRPRHDFKVGDRVRLKDYVRLSFSLRGEHFPDRAEIVSFGKFSPSLANIRFDGFDHTQCWLVSHFERVTDDANAAVPPKGQA